MKKKVDIIFQIIRGEILWNSLEEIGIRIHFDNFNNCEVESDIDTSIIAKPTYKDIVQGFNKLKQMPNVLQKWASIILVCNFIDLYDLHSDEIGERILNILWDVAGDKVLSKDDNTFLSGI